MANKVNVELSANVQGFVDGMNQASSSAQKYETEVKKISESTVNFRKEFAQAKKSAQNLAASYAQLDKEAKKSTFGREMARQLQEAKDKAAEFLDLQGDLNAELKNLASDTRTFDLLSEGFGVIGDSVSTTMGIMAQFTGNEKDAQKAVVMFTTTTSALSAVTKIQNALQMQSNTMLAVTRVQTLAATAATNLKTAAEGKSIVTTKAAAVAQAAFNKIAYANPYVLLAAAITGVIAALVSFIAFSGKAEDAQEAENKAKERAKAINDAYYDTYNSNLSETLGNYTKLQVEWKNLKSEGEKNKWIKDNADAFHNLGYEINDTGAAEKFFVDNEAAVIASFVARAEAAALAAQQVEVFSQALRDIPKPGETKSKDWFEDQGLSTKGRKDVSSWYAFTPEYEVTEQDVKSQTDKRLAEARKSGEQLGKLYVEAEQKANKRAAEVGVKTYTQTRNKLLKSNSGGSSSKNEIINKNSLEYAEKKLKDLQQQLNKIDITDLKAVESLQKQIEDAKKEVSKRKITLGLEIETKIVDGSSEWWDKKIKDLKDAQKKLVEGSVEWIDVKDQIKALEDARKTMTEGVTIEGSAGLGKALSGDFEHSMKGYSDAISEIQNKLQSIDWSTPEGAEQFDKYVEKIQQFKAELSTLSDAWEEAMMTPTEKAEKKLEETSATIKSVGDAINATGQMFSALGEATDSEELKVTGIIAQAIATVALSFAQAMKTTSTWVDWLVFGVTGLTTMMSVISSIKQATAGSYADGGIIGGSSYSGDRLLARVNSHEMILNDRQQRNLFNLLDTGVMPQRGGTNVQVTGVVRGTDLLLVQKNTNKVRAKSGSQIYF